ncbi:hypothetical protein L228DRAFT_176229 [Xylona heveae TC161]|uniref:Uncharacterized protein n=1 Tax=Xylona heveae (strain CBS 132557 / TC161) TaxID=1328760 RepID=A0A165AKR0_XYLHT|nr:hypothetical protein L228DRAFT_176229 [Xylona heveae TC161]KZF20648.1 hypothetical protein L228DRAFT_176229 [Xylona heveae TC161]
MFCLRSWLPVLFIPTNASPAFIFMFFVSTYFLNRPCVYCSLLLLMLFVSSCYWSDHCFLDLRSNWFEPRHFSSPLPASMPMFANDSLNASNMTMSQASFLAQAINETASSLTGAAVEGVKKRVELDPQWTGLGVEWMRRLLGRREWNIPCVDVIIRL